METSMPDQSTSQPTRLPAKIVAFDSDQLYPGLSRVVIPEKFRHHPMVDGKLCYTVPRDLICRIVAEVGESYFDLEVVEMERALADACPSPWIGFWNGRPVRSDLLASAPTIDNIDAETLDDLPWTAEQKKAVQELLPQAGDELEQLRIPMRGYAGWLLINKQFLREHDQLLLSHADYVAEHGMLRMGATNGSVADAIPQYGDRIQMKGKQSIYEEPTPQPSVNDADAIATTTKPASAVTQDSSRFEAATVAFEEFYVRWRLQEFNGPYVPEPLVPQLPVRHLPSVLGHMKDGGQTFYFPDTFPIPGRDKLRSLLEDILRPQLPAQEHLAAWQGLVNSSHAAKIQLSRYARLFRLQHYVRQLYSRHAEALSAKKTKLYIALGLYFELSERAIENDMALIAERLGSGWEEDVRAN